MPLTGEGYYFVMYDTAPPELQHWMRGKRDLLIAAMHAELASEIRAVSLAAGENTPPLLGYEHMPELAEVAVTAQRILEENPEEFLYKPPSKTAIAAGQALLQNPDPRKGLAGLYNRTLEALGLPISVAGSRAKREVIQRTWWNYHNPEGWMPYPRRSTYYTLDEAGSIVYDLQTNYKPVSELKARAWNLDLKYGLSSGTAKHRRPKAQQALMEVLAGDRSSEGTTFLRNLNDRLDVKAQIAPPGSLYHAWGQGFTEGSRIKPAELAASIERVLFPRMVVASRRMTALDHPVLWEGDGASPEVAERYLRGKDLVIYAELMFNLKQGWGGRKVDEQRRAHAQAIAAKGLPAGLNLDIVEKERELKACRLRAKQEKAWYTKLGHAWQRIAEAGKSFSLKNLQMFAPNGWTVKRHWRGMGIDVEGDGRSRRFSDPGGRHGDTVDYIISSIKRESGIDISAPPTEAELQRANQRRTNPRQTTRRRNPKRLDPTEHNGCFYFDRPAWTPTSARAWLEKHGHEASNERFTIDPDYIAVSQK